MEMDSEKEPIPKAWTEDGKPENYEECIQWFKERPPGGGTWEDDDPLWEKVEAWCAEQFPTIH